MYTYPLFAPPQGRNVVRVTGRGATLEEVIAVARYGAKVEITDEAMGNLHASRAVVDQAVADDRAVYGLNTGFGLNENVAIPREDIERLQENILLSHAVGVGKPVPVEIVRAVMFLAIQKFCLGYSGISPEVPITLARMLNKDVHPYVPEKGSLGASGDLAPLAHIALVVIGHPNSFCLVETDGGYDRMPGWQALAQNDLQPAKVSYKDGLSLINSTNFSTAFLCIAMADAMRVVESADLAAALTFEALLATPRALDHQIHEARPHPGQLYTAFRLRQLLEGSKNLDPTRVQDAYSIRCTPQHHGAAKDVLRQVLEILKIELVSTSDNAIVFTDSRDILSGGNFLGTPLALASDHLNRAMIVLGGISDRRSYRLLDPNTNRGLPAFLVKQPGLHSGYMMLQYTAAALLLDSWARPGCSGLTIPTSAGQEDIVSNSANAARYAYETVRNVSNIVAVELLVAAQGIDLRDHGKERLGRGTHAAHGFIRAHIPFLEKDRLMFTDMEAMERMVRDGSLSRVVREVA